MSERVYQDRSILMFGGSSGIGLKTVAHYAREGVTVFMGTRTPQGFEKAMSQLTRREKIDPNTVSIYPFLADVAEKEQIASATKEVKEQGLEVSDVVFSHATGMDIFMKELDERHLDPIAEIAFGIPIEELEPSDREKVEEKLGKMREDLAVWTEEALPRAIAVNCQGTFNALEVLDTEFGGKIRNKVLINSTWGYLSGVPGVEIPLLYAPVHKSRGLLRDRLQQEGITMGVIVASMVSDTQVGKMFKDFFYNLMDKKQRQAIVASSITMQDVVNATSTLLDSDPTQWPTCLYNRFVYKKEGAIVVENALELSPMYTHPYRF